MGIGLLLGVVLVVGSGPSCADQPATLLRRSGYEVVTRCEEAPDAIVLTMTVVRTTRAIELGRARALRVQFYGVVKDVAAPEGWRATQPKGGRQRVTIVWRPSRPAGVRLGARTTGFRVVLTGDKARLSCGATMSFENGGFGGGC